MLGDLGSHRDYLRDSVHNNETGDQERHVDHWLP